MNFHRLLIVPAVTFAILGASAPVLAAEGDSPAKSAYLRYCGSCHGLGGKGDGIVSQLMNPKPPDLTQLAAANNGTFPHAHLLRVIDGRETVRAHGDSDMPVWGEVFHDEGVATSSPQAEVRGKVMLIVEYLRTIQEK